MELFSTLLYITALQTVHYTIQHIIIHIINSYKKVETGMLDHWAITAEINIHLQKAKEEQQWVTTRTERR